MYSIKQLTIKDILQDAPYIMETIENTLVECAMPECSLKPDNQIIIVDDRSLSLTVILVEGMVTYIGDIEKQ